MFTTGAGIVKTSLRPDSRVAVVGGGPAGLAAAIAAASGGAEVLVFEQLPDAGRRLMATGGGHCNFTNTLGTDEFARRFGPGARFVLPALRATDGAGLRAFFEGLGVPAHSPDGFHVFPKSNSAASVRDALVQACGRLGVSFHFGACVRGLGVVDGRVVVVEAGAQREAVSAVVLAAGGASRPELGGGKSGFALAGTAGHTIAEPCPALVPLVTGEQWPGTLAGLTVPMIEARCEIAGGPTAVGKGPLLFTHRGVSGPAVLDISGTVAAALKSHAAVPLLVDLAPDLSVEQWRKAFDCARREHGARVVLSVLRARFPVALARVILDQAGVPADTTMARASAAQIRTIISRIGALPMTVTGTDGMRHAMASRGGVATAEIDRKTLESKMVRGLFFAGEVIDVDGPCGGFNLHWAFASGLLAGAGAARR